MKHTARAFGLTSGRGVVYDCLCDGQTLGGWPRKHRIGLYSPSSVAVNQSTGDVFVLDEGHSPPARPKRGHVKHKRRHMTLTS